MLTIQQKYFNHRPKLQDGDLILFRGTKILAKIIQHCDRDQVTKEPAYFNHIGIVLKTHDAFFIVDSQASGVVADRLSKRIEDYENGDFCVIQSTILSGKTTELDALLKRQDINEVLYDYGNGFKELLNRRFGWNLKIKPTDKKDICSDFVYTYALKKGMILPFQNRVAFPMDYIRHRNKEQTNLLGYKD